MKFLPRLLVVLLLAMLVSNCVTSRTAFTPESGPPTVGMPSQLSERERTFVPQVESVLRDQGYVLVRHGSGDMQLVFEIAEGPVNTDTKIELHEGRRVLANGHGRGAGVPLLGRAKVAERSFNQALESFHSSLPSSPGGGSGGWTPAASDDAAEYVY